MSETVALQEWMNAAVEATVETANAILGVETRVVEAPPALETRQFPGAYIGLTAPNQAVQVGLVARPEALQAIAKAMLGMAPEDEDLPSSDVADAVGELANIFAGAIKQRMLPRVGALGLGLPLFINGHIEPTEKLTIQAVDLQLGSVASSLLVIREREGAR